ncbi:hypothetical protein U0D24_21795 [Hafnia paralvei]|jgi:hypothetical protein|uniref:hypothetical protein n=1 Tax=Hafnia paralvei TaxID=546367 RepID=UPI002FDBC44B
MAQGGSGFKAPPPQEISCVLPIPNQRPRVRAKVDSNGQIWTTTNNAAWIKGSIANSNNNDYFQINVTLSGIEGFGGYNQSGGGGSSSSNQARCTAAWKY